MQIFQARFRYFYNDIFGLNGNILDFLLKCCILLALVKN